MSELWIRHCQCPLCQHEPDHPDKRYHHEINLLMSRLDEPQRRWYAALEARRHGHGGVRLLAQITGLDEKTIRRGQHELTTDLLGCPPSRLRQSGAGRPLVEKNSPMRKPH
jgi:hypothetical protein